jgi:hypothetical protein
VPSTLVLDGGRLVYPDPITIINASYRFYLESVPDLVDNIRGQDESAGTRAKWVERLELWTLKAIEDHSLLERQRT